MSDVPVFIRTNLKEILMAIQYCPAEELAQVRAALIEAAKATIDLELHDTWRRVTHEHTF